MERFYVLFVLFTQFQQTVLSQRGVFLAMKRKSWLFFAKTISWVQIVVEVLLGAWLPGRKLSLFDVWAIVASFFDEISAFFSLKVLFREVDLKFVNQSQVLLWKLIDIFILPLLKFHLKTRLSRFGLDFEPLLIICQSEPPLQAAFLVDQRVLLFILAFFLK